MNEKQLVRYLAELSARGEMVDLKAQQFESRGPYRAVVVHQGSPVIVEQNRYRHLLFATPAAFAFWVMPLMMRFNVKVTFVDSDGKEDAFQIMGSSEDDDFIDDGQELPPDCWAPSLR